MYPIAIVGANPTARAAVLACRRSGFADITWAAGRAEPSLPAITLPANLTRIINALGRGEQLLQYGHAPDREQVRFAASGFLLSELPLGKFAADRYGAPHVNLEAADLDTVLELTEAPLADFELDDLARNHKAVLVCARPRQENSAVTHSVWHTRTPYDPAVGKANITWLGRGQTAWQFSTSQHTHYLFCTPVNAALEPGAWHPSLHGVIAAATPLGDFDGSTHAVREHWHEGNVAYLGEACYRANVYRREGLALGLEDAWVLSRMLENYEEDIQAGLAEYEKYRRPRARRVARATAEAVTQQNLQAPLRRITRNLNIAVSTRFLPEIAMQRIDWFYNYDCIRGFN